MSLIKDDNLFKKYFRPVEEESISVGKINKIFFDFLKNKYYLLYGVSGSDTRPFLTYLERDTQKIFLFVDWGAGIVGHIFTLKDSAVIPLPLKYINIINSESMIDEGISLFDKVICQSYISPELSGIVSPTAPQPQKEMLAALERDLLKEKLSNSISIKKDVPESPSLKI